MDTQPHPDDIQEFSRQEDTACCLFTAALLIALLLSCVAVGIAAAYWANRLLG